MNPGLEKFRILRDTLRGGPDCHARSFAEGVLLGYELAGVNVTQPVQRIVQQPQTVRQALYSSERMPDSGLFDKNEQPAVDSTPNGFPQDASKAAIRAQAIGIDGSFAARIWVERQSAGWVNTSGKTIIDWDKYLAGVWKHEQARRIQQANA